MSNSLTDLNSFSLDPIVFEDQRGYAITFSAASTANTSTSIAEDESFVVPTGIDIVSVLSQPGNITYTVSNATADVVASWPTPLPSGISNISAGNVFSITGTFNSETWTQARGLVMTAPDREEDFSFDATLTYPDPANVAQTDTWNWNNTVVITETNQDWINITVPRSYINNNFDFLFPDTVPAISDDSGSTYDITLTTSSNIGIITLDNSLTAPSDWDFDTLTFSFTGNRTQVNQMLGQIRFIANLGADSTATVQLNSTTNPDIPFTASFDLNHQSALHLVKPALDIVYDEDQSDPVVDGANIATVQTTTHYTQDWSVVISQQLDDEPANNLAKLGGTGWTVMSGPNPGFPRAIFKSSGPVTTVTDLLSRFNVFDTVTVGAAPDADVDYVLRVETGTELVSVFDDIFQQTPQVFIRGVFVGETHEEFNFPDTGSYIENTLLTMPTPLITDLDPTVSTDPAFQAYNLQITQESGAPGAFFVNGSQTPEAGRLAFISNPVGVQLSNTKDPINSLNIEFMPAVNNSDPVQLRYTQFKSNDLSGNVAQANVLSTYTGTPVVHVINMTDRTFVDQQTNAIFANSTPEITDGSQQAQTYTITLSSTAGLFGNSVANAVSTSSYTFTGTRSECNTEFSNMVFVPNVTESGLPTNNTFTYTQTRSDTVQVNLVQNLVKSSSAAISPIDQAFDSTGTFEFSEQQALYGKITLVTVGGGGGGGCCGGGQQGGGGGGGEARTNNGSRTGAFVILPGVVNLVVGSGGAVDTAGSNSFVISNSVTLFNALGGQPGNTTHGGESGFGRTGGLPSDRASGGGAGFRDPNVGNINASTFFGGDGEAGRLVNIDTAFDGRYGGGGGGGFNAAAGGSGVGDGSRRFNLGGGGYGNADPGLANSGGGGGAGAAGGSGRIILKIR